MEEPKMVAPQMDITDDDKLWALLGWIIPLIALIALLMEEKKGRPFIKYNAMQAVIMGVIIILLTFVPVIGWILEIALWVYAIVLGIQSYKGEWVTVPALTDFCKGQGWI